MTVRLIRHFIALLRKNVILKVRRPVWTFLELVFSLLCPCLLAGILHTLGGADSAPDHPIHRIAEMEIARLPHCADFRQACPVRLVKGGASCIDGAYSCLWVESGEKLKGLRLMYGCSGEFNTGPGTPTIHCTWPKDLNKLQMHDCLLKDAMQRPQGSQCTVEPRTPCGNGAKSKGMCPKECCWTPTAEHPCHLAVAATTRAEDQQQNGTKRRLAGTQASGLYQMMELMQFASEGNGGGQRYDANFAVVPSDGGGRAFISWMKKTRHPWAGNAKLFESEEALQNFIQNPDYGKLDVKLNRSGRVCGAVIFETPPWEASARYTLRFNTSHQGSGSSGGLLDTLSTILASFSTGIDFESLVGNLAVSAGSTSALKWYATSGFLSMQRSVDAFLEVASVSTLMNNDGFNKTAMPLAGSSLLSEDDRMHAFVPFPTLPSQIESQSRNFIINLISVALLPSLAFHGGQLAQDMVEEREMKLAQGMQMMGLHPLALHLSWVCTFTAQSVVANVLVSFVLVFGGVMPHSSVFALAPILVLFSSSIMGFAMILSAFFSRGKTASVACGAAICISSFFANMAPPSSPRNAMLRLFLIPGACTKWIGWQMEKLEIMGIGVNWSTIDALSQGSVSVTDAILMLCIDTILFFCIFVCLDHVMPREFGARRPSIFQCFTFCYRKLVKRRHAESRDGKTDDQTNTEELSGQSLIEPEFCEIAALMCRNGTAIELKGVSKEFGNFVAVHDLNMTLVQGEIFALLGHNGAGKTTTISMLCGLIVPTHGCINVFGHDLAHEPEKVMKLLGICPQHDVLWPALTGAEHLQLFAAFKGLPRKQTTVEVLGMLARVGLLQAEAGTVEASHLSGGMKRKLCLAIAFLGDPRAVILDEPTSGMDPLSRRGVWDLVRDLKQGRAILISTHYMDEADILGDRIAILRAGSLQCCGSPQFLKRTSGCGYKITFVKLPGCDSRGIVDAVADRMFELAAGVELYADCCRELIVRVPFEGARHFPVLLDWVQNNLDTLGAESYGVSTTTMEEVFLRFASEGAMRTSTSAPQMLLNPAPVDPIAQLRQEVIEMNDWVSLEPDSNAVTHKLSGSKVNLDCGICGFQHLRALLKKRFLYGVRDFRGCMCHVLCPMASLHLLLYILLCWSVFEAPRLELNPLRYNQHCRHGNQNNVDYTHLHSVKKHDAKKLLEPGKSFWNGDLRYHKPKMLPGETATMDVCFERMWSDWLPHLVSKVRAPVHEKPRIFRDMMRIVLNGTCIIQRGRRLSEDQFDGGTHPDLINELPGVRQEDLVDLRKTAVTGLRRLWESAVDRRELTQWFKEREAGRAKRAMPASSAQAKDAQLTAAKPSSGRGAKVAQLTTAKPAGSEQAKVVHLATAKPSSGEDTEGVPEVVQLRKNWFSASSHSVLWDMFIVAMLETYPEMTIGCEGAFYIEHRIWSLLAGEGPGHTVSHVSQKRIKKVVNERLQNSNSVVRALINAVLDSGLDIFPKDAVTGGKMDISKEFFCKAMTPLRSAGMHLWDTAKQFSSDLAETADRAQCPRYGSYFVIHEPASRAPVGVVNKTSLHATSIGPRISPMADAVVFVNLSSPHAAPAFQSVLTNARLKRLGVERNVTVSVHPLPSTATQSDTVVKDSAVLLAGCIALSMAPIASSIVYHGSKERASGARQLQSLAGVSILGYWIPNFVYDVVVFSLPAAHVLFALWFYGFGSMLQGMIPAFSALLFAFGLANTSLSYLCSALSTDYAKAANIAFSLNLVGSLVLVMILSVLEYANFDATAMDPFDCKMHDPLDPNPKECAAPHLYDVNRFLESIFQLVPGVPLARAIVRVWICTMIRSTVPPGIVQMIVSAEKYESLPAAMSPNGWLSEFLTDPFSHRVTGWAIKWLLAESVVYFALAALVDKLSNSANHSRWFDRVHLCAHIFRYSKKRKVRNPEGSVPFLRGEMSSVMHSHDLEESNTEDDESASAPRGDNSVDAEVERAAHVYPRDVSLHVWLVRKAYWPWFSTQGQKRAVKGVTMTVHAGEVFGLLGHNGAGKTSLLKCIVGEQCCTSGEIHIGGFDLRRQTDKARKQIGYCPQFDALLEFLTVRDHLDLYTSLKSSTTSEAMRLLRSFGLESSLHRRADFLSGGNRRKLSAIIALLGTPAVAVLDEPSCGMDPVSRRVLWNAILESCSRKGSNQPLAILLTTHSMEEAESLSTRLGIMGSGRMITVGTPQQIKQRHGSCHELVIKLKSETEECVRRCLDKLGGPDLSPDSVLSKDVVLPIIHKDPIVNKAFCRTLCGVRTQFGETGLVQASVLVHWWLQAIRGEAVECFLREVAGNGVELAESNGTTVRFKLPHGGRSLPEFFRYMEESGPSLGISEYTLNQSTLEQIFNNIAGKSES